MENNNQAGKINRRKFLQTGSMFAASAVILPYAGYKLFGDQKPSASARLYRVEF